jgi:hypothetical protein
VKSENKSPGGFQKWTFLKMSKNEKLRKVLKKGVFLALLDHNALIYKNNENYIVIVILQNYNLKKSLFLLYGNFRKQIRGKKVQKGAIRILLRKV